MDWVAIVPECWVPFGCLVATRAKGHQLKERTTPTNHWSEGLLRGPTSPPLQSHVVPRAEASLPFLCFCKQGWEPGRSFCPLQKMIIALLAGGGKPVVWLVETGEWHCPKRTNHMSKPVNIPKAAFNFPQLLKAVEKAFKHADFTLQVFNMPSTHQSARTHPLPPRRCRVLAS